MARAMIRAACDRRGERMGWDMGSRTVRYGTREEMHGGVERLGAEGWMLAGIRKLPDGALEATYSTRASSMPPHGQTDVATGGGPTGGRSPSGRAG